MSLASTMLFAQDLHWVPVIEPTSMQMSAVLQIDGVEIGEEALQLEIGFFDQDGVCRAAKLPKLKKGHYRYSPVINGVDGETTTYTCRIWDHNTDSERTDLTFVQNEDDPLIWAGNGASYGSSSNLYVLHFVTTTTGFELPITGYGEGTGK